jgi:hypothetical protein
MKLFALGSAVSFCLFFTPLVRGQNTGRIECARSGGYVYLYSSIATLEVRATLQCGEIVYITSRYDDYFGVHNAKGETGFVPLASVVVLKDQPGTGLPVPAEPSRERIHYDERPSETSAPVRTPVPTFTLPNNTPVRMKLVKTISSATAHVGDPVEFEVLDDVLVEGIAVLPKGSKAGGVIAASEPKKRFGHSGKLAVSITSVHLADGEQAPVRCYQEASGVYNTSHGVLPLASGKDIIMAQNTEFTALVDGDFHMKREAFATPKDASPAPPAQAPQPQH